MQITTRVCICEECKGNNLQFMASVQWDVATEDFFVFDVDEESGFCRDCKVVVGVIWKDEKIGTPEKVATEAVQ